MTEDLDELIFNAIEKEIEKDFPEKIEKMTNDDILYLVLYISKGFPDFVKNEMKMGKK